MGTAFLTIAAMLRDQFLTTASTTEHKQGQQQYHHYILPWRRGYQTALLSLALLRISGQRRLKYCVPGLWR